MRNSVELTLARLALRQFLGSRRALWIVALALLPIVLALMIQSEAGGDPKEALGDVNVLYQMLIVSVLLPILALVIGTGVFGAEVDDGTITYVLGKPVPRWRIVLTRTVVAGLLTAAVLAPTTLITTIVGTRGVTVQGLPAAFTLAVVAGCFLYCALFVALSLSTRRALVVGLGYVVIWEGLLSNTFGGSRALSVRQYTLAIAEELASAPGVALSRLDVTTALAMAAVVTALALFHSIRRLRVLEIGEAA